MKIQIEITDEQLQSLVQNVPVEHYERYPRDESGEYSRILAWVGEYCEGAIDELVYEFDPEYA